MGDGRELLLLLSVEEAMCCWAGDGDDFGICCESRCLLRLTHGGSVCCGKEMGVGVGVDHTDEGMRNKVNENERPGLQLEGKEVLLNNTPGAVDLQLTRGSYCFSYWPALLSSAHSLPPLHYPSPC